MEKLLRECESCSEEKQTFIVDKCLQSAKDNNETMRNLAWLGLSKLIPRCSSQNLRACQSRVAKRLVDVEKETNIYSAMFLRHLMIRNPQIGEIHSGTVSRIISNLLDQSVCSGNVEMKKLSIEIFCIRYGLSQTNKIIKTLHAVLDGSLISPEQRNDLLNLRTLGRSEAKDCLVTTLFDLLSSTFSYASKGETIERDLMLSLLEKGLALPSTRDVVLRCMQSFCCSSQASIYPIMSGLITPLIALLDIPTVDLLETLTTVNNTFGSSSTLYKHFYILFSSLRKPLHDLPYFKAGLLLLASIVRSSAALIKPEVFIAVQREVLDEVSRSFCIDDYLPILEAFLYQTNELVPIPLQIIRSLLVSRLSQSTRDSSVGNLCQLLSRPRIQNLSSVTVQQMKQATDVENGSKKIEEDHEKVAEMDDRVSCLLKEIHEETRVEEVEEKDDEECEVVAIVSPTKTFVSPTKVETIDEKVSLSTKRSSETVKAKIPKKKKKHSEIVLEKGEASVDDIMGSFCFE